MPIIQTPPCMLCDASSFVDVTTEEHAAIQATPYIQHAVPHRSEAFRELLISGTHEQCWDSMFADEDD